MGTHPYTVVDVFTSTPLAGNALAVVHEADDLDEATMAAFARETRLSETTFVQGPGEAAADYRNRIWTVEGELAFAGHPSLGTAVAVARRRGQAAARYVQETGAGLQPVEVALDDRRARASMLQRPADFGTEAEPGPLLDAVGLAPSEAHPSLGPQVVSTGLATLVVPVAEREAVARARPDPEALAEAISSLGDANFYLVWPDPAGGRAHARMFTPLVAGGEDPATGSAAGPLCAYLSRRLGWPRVEVTQGVEMGRPSLLVAAMEEGGVRVGGDVVVLMEGALHL